MMRYQLTLQAEEDLKEIAAYISKDSPKAAARLVRKIREKCRLVVARYPEAGKACNELAEGLRCSPVGSYLIFYEGKNPVRIVRILHGARYLKSLFP